MLVDDRFNPVRCDAYDLYIEIQFNRLRFIAKKDEEILCLEDHFLGVCTDPAQTSVQVDKLMAIHPFLSRKDWKSVHLISQLQVHAVVPTEARGDAEKYLSLVFNGIHTDNFTFFSEVFEKQTLHIGTLTSIFRTFQKYYERIELHSPLAAGLRLTLERRSPQIIISDQFLDYYYYYPKKGSVSIRRIPLKDLETLDIENHPTTLWGEITPFGNLYNQLKEKITEIEMGNINKGIANFYSEIPQHRYITLLNI
jgi:hypothetical protein